VCRSSNGHVQNLVAFNALLAVQTFKFVLPQVFFFILFITQLIIIYRYYDNDNDDVRPPPGITGTNEQGARDADTFWASGMLLFLLFIITNNYLQVLRITTTGMTEMTNGVSRHICVSTPSYVCFFNKSLLLYLSFLQVDSRLQVMTNLTTRTYGTYSYHYFH
jgi:hypothetical protein